MKLLKICNFTFFHNVFYAICILKSFKSHISVVVCSFFEFRMVSNWCIKEWVKAPFTTGFAIAAYIVQAETAHKVQCVISSAMSTIQGNSGQKQSLTHSQTTNFRLFQTERVYRQQYLIWWKWQKVHQKGWKHSGKTIIAHYEHFLLFAQCFHQTWTADTIKGLFGKGLTCNCVHFDLIVDWKCLVMWHPEGRQKILEVIH